MKCPQCGGELKYPDHAYYNMSCYRNACTVVTLCCGKAVRLIPRMEIEAVAAKGVTVDEWGDACNE